MSVGSFAVPPMYQHRVLLWGIIGALVMRGMMDEFLYLKIALAMVLMVVGVKMLTAEWLKDHPGGNFNLYLLLVIVSILAAGVVGSLWADRRDGRRGA